jgi:hypothetical protein
MEKPQQQQKARSMMRRVANAAEDGFVSLNMACGDPRQRLCGRHA